MPIYYDSSEGRVNTRLPKEVVQYGKPVAGLEAQTGADLLISPLDAPLPSNVNRPPGSLVLCKHCEAGMLVQRKSGGDMLNSIPHLAGILQRMQQWNTVSWLLICGKYEPNEDEEVIADSRKSGWQWAALQGAIDSWMLRGGLVHQEPDDDHGGYWLNRWDMNIHKLRKDAVIAPPVQKFVGGMFDPHPWRTTLMSFPGCGEELSRRIAAYTGDLAHALWYMTDMQSDRLKGVQGVGPKLIEQWQHFAGLRPGEALIPFDASDAVVPPPMNVDLTLKQLEEVFA